MYKIVLTKYSFPEPSPPDDAPKESRLFALPAELRFYIYENLLCINCHDGVPRVWYNHWGTIGAAPLHNLTQSSMIRLHVSIIRVCKQVYREAIDILYTKNQFCVKASHHYSILSTQRTFGYLPIYKLRPPHILKSIPGEWNISKIVDLMIDVSCGVSRFTDIEAVLSRFKWPALSRMDQLKKVTIRFRFPQPLLPSQSLDMLLGRCSETDPIPAALQKFFQRLAAAMPKTVDAIAWSIDVRENDDEWAAHPGILEKLWKEYGKATKEEMEELKRLIEAEGSN